MSCFLSGREREGEEVSEGGGGEKGGITKGRGVERGRLVGGETMRRNSRLVYLGIFTS